MIEIFEPSSSSRGHVHRPAFWVCLGLMIGIAIDPAIKIPLIFLVVFVFLSILLNCFVIHKNISAVLWLIIFIMVGSVYRRSYETFEPNHISHITYSERKNPVVIEGMVGSDVEPRPFFKKRKTVFTLEIKRIKSKGEWKEKSGLVLVNLFRMENIKYGDYLRLEGKLHKPFNFSSDTNFSYRDYLSRRGITFILSIKKDGRVEILKRHQGNVLADVSFRIKHRLISILKRHLPKMEAGIMQAFLLGDRYDIPKDFYDLCKLSGVAHIIAISGYNIGIVTFVIFLILKIFPISRRIQYVLTMILLIFYAFMTGAQPPVVRATIMAMVFLMSLIIEREQDSINTLSLSAVIILLMNPLNLFDVGFQLSFISVLFIIVFYSRLLNLFYKLFRLDENIERRGIREAVVKYFLQSMALSVVAYMGVLPLVVYYFHLVTPIVFLANLLIIPLSSLIIFLGIGLLIVGILCPYIAFTFANCITILMNLMVAGIVFFTKIPGAYFAVSNLPVWSVYTYYGLILGAYFLLDIRQKLSYPSIGIDKNVPLC
ncbi:MAG: ComEC family competence protein [Candidatus Omnitrophica bacterium]|nr:ComEC family competence protein [Candidatus Omnitrophota bacterium]